VAPRRAGILGLLEVALRLAKPIVRSAAHRWKYWPHAGIAQQPAYRRTGAPGHRGAVRAARPASAAVPATQRRRSASAGLALA
jgi:hypothetical protein